MKTCNSFYIICIKWYVVCIKYINKTKFITIVLIVQKKCLHIMKIIKNEFLNSLPPINKKIIYLNYICALKNLAEIKYVIWIFLIMSIYRMVLVMTLVFTTKKDLRVSTRQTGLQTSIGCRNLQTQTGCTCLLEFTGRTEL